jgi:PKD repeat protein
MGGTGGTATNGALAGGTGYGYNGGSSSTTTKYGGGGGGGAGSTGGGGSGSAAGAGGTGTSNSITGTATYYGGGGGGGIVSTGTIGTGGSSIGGSGGDLGSSPTNAAASTGSGGGGAGGKTAAGGTGAGGVIIVSYTQLPGASFTMNTTSGYSPLAVSFTDTSNPVGTSWQWGFNNVTGNNTWTNFATTENPVWTFGIGNYSVNLTATNSGGSSKFTNTTFINVTAVPPVAAFTMNTTAGYSPLAVSFTDTSNPVGTAWQWGFNNVTGNNTWTNFATTENPVWTFGIGNYSVNLTATNSGGSSKFTNTTFINVTAVPPVASFTVSPISGIPPLGISLNDTSTNTPTSWSWGAKNVTGNNTWIPIGNRLQNDVAMLGSGNWSINLTAANSGGSNISTQISFVNVSGIVPLPIGNFTENGLYTQTSGNAPFPVQFNYVQSNGTTSWFWMFGDGSTSTDQNPLHTYTVAGIYTVNHSVTNSFGTGWTNRTGAVMAIMVSMFTPWPGPVTRWYPAGVYFQDQSAGSPTSVNWSFGDGTIANLTTAIYHQFPHSAASQVYTITETACTASACSTNSSIVQIHPT